MSTLPEDDPGPIGGVGPSTDRSPPTAPPAESWPLSREHLAAWTSDVWYRAQSKAESSCVPAEDSFRRGFEAAVEAVTPGIVRARIAHDALTDQMVKMISQAPAVVTVTDLEAPTAALLDDRPYQFVPRAGGAHEQLRGNSESVVSVPPPDLLTAPRMKPGDEATD